MEVGAVLGAHSGSVSCCSQAQAESMAMTGVWVGVAGPQPSTAGMHRELVQALLLSILPLSWSSLFAADLLGPHPRDGAAPSLTGLVSIRRSTSEALKTPKISYL